MNPSIPPNGPQNTGAYVPYFYQSGLYLWHDRPRHPVPASPSARTYATYDFSSDGRITRPFSYPQNVEQVIARGYLAIPQSDPETAILTDKGHTSWLGLDDLIGQVRRRYEIYQTNMEGIQEARLSSANSMHSVIASRGNVAVNSREAYSINKSLRELYQQESDERVRLWQDVSKLRLLLPETAQSYLSAHRKLSILGAPPGDAP